MPLFLWMPPISDSLLASQLSDALSAATQINSRALVAQSFLSDIKSAIAAITVTISPSDVSDIASAVLAGLTGLTPSDISDIASAVWAHVVGARVDSRVLVVKSQASDIASYLVAMSSMESDIYSAVSDLSSDVKSAVAVGNSRATVIQSMASDAASAAQQANSRVLLAQSVLSGVLSAVTGLPTAKLIAHAAAVLKVVVDAGSTTTAVVFASVEGGAPSATNDFYNGRVIIFTSGALNGQATSISAYVGGTVTATVVALTGAPAQNVTAVIV